MAEGAPGRPVAELQPEEPAVTLSPEVLKDSAPVLEGLKVTVLARGSGVQPPDASGSRGSRGRGARTAAAWLRRVTVDGRGVWRASPEGRRPSLGSARAPRAGRPAGPGVWSLRRLTVLSPSDVLRTWVLASGSLAVLPWTHTQHPAPGGPGCRGAAGGATWRRWRGRAHGQVQVAGSWSRREEAGGRSVWGLPASRGVGAL